MVTANLIMWQPTKVTWMCRIDHLATRTGCQCRCQWHPRSQPRSLTCLQHTSKGVVDISWIRSKWAKCFQAQHEGVRHWWHDNTELPMHMPPKAAAIGTYLQNISGSKEKEDRWDHATDVKELKFNASYQLFKAWMLLYFYLFRSRSPSVEFRLKERQLLPSKGTSSTHVARTFLYIPWTSAWYMAVHEQVFWWIVLCKLP